MTRDIHVSSNVHGFEFVSLIIDHVLKRLIDIKFLYSLHALFNFHLITNSIVLLVAHCLIQLGDDELATTRNA
jgi:hypothetical protein